MEIRKAGIEKVKDISRIHALSWKSAYRGIVPRAYLDELKEDFWVAPFSALISENVLTALLLWENGNCLGCVSFGKARDKEKTDWGEIFSLYLLPEYFGKGYGSRLLESALAALKRAGYQDIYLWVLKDNQRARRFYAKNGMQCTEEECVWEVMGERLTEVRYVFSFNSSGK